METNHPVKYIYLPAAIGICAMILMNAISDFSTKSIFTLLTIFITGTLIVYFWQLKHADRSTNAGNSTQAALRRPGGNECQVIDFPHRAGNINVTEADIENLGHEVQFLVLNTIIEAARAGEQGRTIAEFASQIRSVSGYTKRFS